MSRHRLPLLVPLLTAIALELALHRVAVQALRPQVLQTESDLFRLFNGGVGPLFFYFASFLALAACTWMLLLVVREDWAFPLPWRVVLGLFSCVFLPVCAVGVFVSPAGIAPVAHSLRELHPYLNLFFAAMVGALAAGLLAQRAPILPTLGVLLLLAPLLGFAYFSYRAASMLGQAPGVGPIFEQLRRVSAVPQELRAMFLYAGPWVFLAFVPLVGLAEGTPERSGAAAGSPGSQIRRALSAYGQVILEPGPMVVGLAAAALLGIGIKVGYAPLRVVADAAFAYDLPMASAGTLPLLGSFALFCWTVAALAWRAGPTRTAALGLCCLAVAGMRLAEPLHSLQLPEPVYYLLAVVGLLAVIVGTVGAAERAARSRLEALSPQIPGERWMAFLQRAGATLAGAGGPAMILRRVVDGEQELSGLEGRHRGLALALYFRRQGARVESFTAALGQALDQRADWLATRSATGPASGEGRPAGQLKVRDRAGLGDRLTREGLLERLAEGLRGEVEVWLHVGVRYRLHVSDAEALGRHLPLHALAAPEGGEPTPEALVDLLALLYTLAERAGVSPPPGGEEAPSPAA